MRRITSKKKSVYGLVCIVLLGLSSCRTTRVVTTSTAKPIATNKLIQNIESNAFDYKYFSIKRVNCQFDNGQIKTSFKAGIFAEKDKRITVMLSKLNIPVARIWLTPDSVKFINYLENNYYLGDYRYLSSMLGMDLDFKTVNAIISNNVFSLRDEKTDKDSRDYKSKIDSGMYVLESVEKLNSKRNNPRTGERKSSGNAQKMITDAPIRQSIYVDPVTFKLLKIRMEDAENSRNLNIVFSDFVPVEKQLYPGEIDLHFLSPENYMEMRIRLGNFSLEDEKDIRFRVPEKFTRINHN